MTASLGHAGLVPSDERERLLTIGSGEAASSGKEDSSECGSSRSLVHQGPITCPHSKLQDPVLSQSMLSLSQ